MKTKTTRSLLALLLVAVAAVAAACGSGSDDGENGASVSSSGANATDRAFVAQMVPHHQMAVQMAGIAQKQAQHSQIKTAADAIVAAQSDEITQLKDIASELGVKPAAMPSNGMNHDAHAMDSDAKALGLSMDDMGMSMDMDALMDAKAFDRAFIDSMIPHHQGAIRMARAEIAKGRNPELKKIAHAIVDAQTSEINEMNDWRAKWYGEPSPAGGVPKA